MVTTEAGERQRKVKIMVKEYKLSVTRWVISGDLPGVHTVTMVNNISYTWNSMRESSQVFSQYTYIKGNYVRWWICLLTWLRYYVIVIPISKHHIVPPKCMGSETLFSACTFLYFSNCNYLFVHISAGL